jgi:HAD superfamily hydrolase (TIGR01509 family)
MLKACIFDMDGVIIDSEPMHFEVDLLVMKRLGLSLTHEDLEAYVGMTNPAMWTILKEQYDLQQAVEDLIQIQMGIKLRILRERNEQPIAGIIQLLESLKEAGISIGLASSSPRIFIQAVLEKFGLDRHFSSIVSGEEVERGKPAPDVFIQAASELHIHPSHCLVIEDSRNGVAAAKAAGMACIGFINPNSGQQDLSQADLTVVTITEIKLETMKKLVEQVQ